MSPTYPCLVLASCFSPDVSSDVQESQSGGSLFPRIASVSGHLTPMSSLDDTGEGGSSIMEEEEGERRVAAAHYWWKIMAVERDSWWDARSKIVLTREHATSFDRV